MHPASDSDAGLEARYANYFKVGQNSTEFLLQFGQFHPGSDLVWITRVVISPVFAKELLNLMIDAVNVHESQYGAICPAVEDGSVR